MKTIACFVFSIGLALFAPLVHAAPPQTINYQGYLTNPGGTPVNNAVVMTFKLYDAASGGAVLYTETQLSVNVANGNFNAVVGAVTPITLPFDVQYWLSVAINSDPEMSPRQPLASSPYAFRAASLDSTATLAGSQISGTISNAQIANNAVTQAKLSPISGAAAGRVLGTDGSNLQWQTGSVGTITGVTAGSGLTGGGASGIVGLAVDPVSIQARVTGNCAAGSFISQVNSNGTVVCQADTGGTGNITGNVTMVNSTAVAGNILKNGSRFIHNYGGDNTFVGVESGNLATTGNFNSGFGRFALSSNTSGDGNTAIGSSALKVSTAGGSNTAVGHRSLEANTTGSLNVAIGTSALINNNGVANIAIGNNAGFNITTGVNNIAIGNPGQANESDTIRIGTNQSKTFVAGLIGIITGNTVVVGNGGQIGSLNSSRRFKDDVTDMNAASSALINLRPITFHYKIDQNPQGRMVQYGLIAEEVNEIYPGLVGRSADGQIESVYYQYLTPMLLNEFQKQQRRINALELELQEIKLALRAR